MEASEKKASNIQTFEFSITNNFLPVMIAFVFAAANTMLLLSAIKHKSDIAGTLIVFAPVFFLGFITIVPVVNHIRHDRKRTVHFDHQKQLLTIESPKGSVSFSSNDIKFCRTFSGRIGCSYVLFKIKRGNHYSITSFIADPDTLKNLLQTHGEMISYDLLPTVASDGLS